MIEISFSGRLLKKHQQWGPSKRKEGQGQSYLMRDDYEIFPSSQSSGGTMENLSQEFRDMLSPSKTSTQVERETVETPAKENKSTQTDWRFGKLDGKTEKATLAPTTYNRRLNEARDVMKAVAERHNVTFYELLGALIMHESYVSGRTTYYPAGKAIAEGKPLGQKVISIYKCLYLREACDMTKMNWQNARNLFLLEDVYLQPEHILREIRAQMYPKTEVYHPIPGPNNVGVKAELKDLLTRTISDILLMAEKEGKVSLGPEDGNLALNVSYKWGYDGSGKHLIIGGNAKTKNLIHVCFGVTDVKKPDGTLLWKAADKRGDNSPKNIRPWCFVYDTEDAKVLERLQPDLEKEVAEVKNGFEFRLDNSAKTQVKVGITASRFTMLDGKLLKLLLGLDGCFCTICKTSEKECHDIAKIRAGIKADRGIQGLNELYAKLTGGGAHPIVRGRKDYGRRHGMTSKNITQTDITHQLPVLHAKIRCFEWIVQLLTRLNTSRKWQSKFDQVVYEEGEKEDMKEELFAIRGKLRDELNINVGISNGELEQSTGGMFYTLSSDAGRQELKNMVEVREGDDPQLQEGFDWMFTHLCAIIRVMNSSERKIDIKKYDQLCKDVSVKIVQTFPWAKISESMHRVLAHSAELIEANQNFGLGGQSEEGELGNLIPLDLAWS